MLRIIALTNDTNRGDNDNAIAVQSSTAKLYGDVGSQFAISEYHINDLQILRQEISTNPQDQFIIIGAREQSVIPLASLSDSPNTLTSWSGHQIPASLNASTANRIDSIHLPEYITPHALRHQISNKLVTTPHGVPTSKTRETFVNAYNNEKDELGIPEAPSYITVVLGGDASDQLDNIKHYTAQEAYALGRWMGYHALQTGATILATNGPRTGKHSIESQEEIPNTHRQDSNLDAVSSSFLQGLNDIGLSKNQQRFFDFKYDQPSVLNALMGASLTCKDSLVVMPGDSTSMLTEAVENFSPGQTISYTTSSMNNAHISHNIALMKLGLIHQIEPINGMVNNNNYLSSKMPARSADMVAENIIGIAQMRGMSSPAAFPNIYAGISL